MKKSRNKKGGWVIRRGGKFGRAPQDISDLYISFVLSHNYATLAPFFDIEFNYVELLMK